MHVKKSIKEVIVKIPKRMLNEQTVVHHGQESDDFVYISTKRYVTDYEPDVIRDAMMRGYVEMSKINLKIAAECSHLEFEALDTMERLVSGG